MVTYDDVTSKKNEGDLVNKLAFVLSLSSLIVKKVKIKCGEN